MHDNLPTRPGEPALLPHQFDDLLRARLAELDAASDKHAAGQRPDNTTRSYASDWRTWEAFCAQLQVPTTAATRGTLRAFVDYLWNREKRAYSTIDRKLAGVAVTLRTQHGVVIDPEATRSARELLKTTDASPARTRNPSAAAARPPPCTWMPSA